MPPPLSPDELPLMVLLVIVTPAKPPKAPHPQVKTPPAELPLTVVPTIVAYTLDSLVSLLIPLPPLSLTLLLTTVRLAFPPLNPALLLLMPVPSLLLTLLLTTVRLAVPERSKPRLEIPSALLLTTLSVIVMQEQGKPLGPPNRKSGNILTAPVPELLLM